MERRPAAAAPIPTPAGPPAPGAARAEALALAAATALALAVRLAGIGRESLYLDEGVSAWVTRMTAADIVAWVRGDVHSPLYYLVLHAWRGVFGGSEAALRSLSAVASALTVPVVYALGRRAGGRLAAWAAVAAFTFGTFPLHYAQEARSYALFALATALSWERLLVARDSGGLARWAAYAAATSCAVGLHHFGALAVLAQAVFVVGSALVVRGAASGRRLGAWAAATCAAALPLLPWAATARGQVDRVLVRGEFWTAPPGVMDLARTVWEFAGSWTLLALLAGFGTRALLLAARGRPPLEPERREAAWAMALWAAVPALAAFAISLAWHPIYIIRGLLPSAIPVLVLAGAGVASLPRRPRAPALAVTGAALALAWLGYLNGPHKDPWREAAQLVERRAQPGDVVVVSAGWNRRYAWDYYARRRDLQVVPFPDPTRPEGRAEVARLAGSLARSAGAWVVLSRSEDPQAVLAAAAGASRHAAWDSAFTLRPYALSRHAEAPSIRIVRFAP